MGEADGDIHSVHLLLLRPPLRLDLSQKFSLVLPFISSPLFFAILGLLAFPESNITPGFFWFSLVRVVHFWSVSLYLPLFCMVIVRL